MHPVPAQAVSADTWTRTGTVCWSEDCHPPRIMPPWCGLSSECHQKDFHRRAVALAAAWSDRARPPRARVTCSGLRPTALRD
eukprot:80804-Prymnesium_polylepis.1